MTRDLEDNDVHFVRQLYSSEVVGINEIMKNRHCNLGNFSFARGNKNIVILENFPFARGNKDVHVLRSRSLSFCYWDVILRGNFNAVRNQFDILIQIKQRLLQRAECFKEKKHGDFLQKKKLAW